jgi:hypothetical protein
VTRLKPKERTYTQLITIAASAKRINEDTFAVPSEHDPERIWYVNIILRTCRDKDGKGCPALYYYGDCYHLQSVAVLLDVLKRWINSNE